MFTSLLSNFSATHCTEPFFFGLRAWYHYLETDVNCNIPKFNVLKQDGTSDLLLVTLAIVDDLLRIAGFVAIGFVIYGGILYVTSQGSPEQTQKAQSTVQNALVGLLIAILSVAVVSYFGSKLG